MPSSPSKKRSKQSKNLTLEKTLAALTVTFKTELQNNVISKIMSIQRSDISPAAYSLLEHFQPTSASVEKSCSKLRKLSAKDRNSKVENVNQYMILHLNSCRSGDRRVGCLYKVCALQVLLRICMFSLTKCLF